MRAFRPTTWDSTVYHSNKYSADSACEHCAGILRHEKWCITVNLSVFYAYEIVLHPENMTEHDRCILHALGVAWTCNGCVASGGAAAL